MSWSDTGLEEGVRLVLVTYGPWLRCGRGLTEDMAQLWGCFRLSLRKKLPDWGKKNGFLPCEAWWVSPGRTDPLCVLIRWGLLQGDNKWDEGDDQE